MNRIQMPQKGSPTDQVLDRLESFKSNDANFKDGRLWSLTYYLGEEHRDLLTKAYSKYMFENGLNMMAFQSLKKMETELVGMAASLFNGDENVVGTLTSGGTESILLAVKTYRDKARKERLFVRKPEIIAPETVHVAFDKACEYFNVKLVKAKLRDDYRVDVNDVRKKINRNTIALVGSAPQYPHGVIDPIEELSQLALEKKLPLHVDACVGGFILPFLEMNGVTIPKWNFNLKGVTSISADYHKYAFTAKGASVILYKNIDFLQYQFFISESFPGGLYASAAMSGTKSGGSIAAAWATVQHFGIEGYCKLAKSSYETARSMIDAINSIPGLKVISNPDATLLAYESTDSKVNIFAVADELTRRGWFIDRQQRPECLHCMVMPAHEKSWKEYVSDLRASVDVVRANPKLASTGEAAMYGTAAKMPLRGLVRSKILEVMKDAYR